MIRTIFFVGCGILVLYFVIWPWMKRLPALREVDTFLTDEKTNWWGRLRVSLSGLKRIIFARVVWVAGAIMSIHDLILPHVAALQPLVPEKYRGYALPIFTIVGIIFEWLTRISPQPVGEVNPGVVVDVTAKSLAVVEAVTATDPVVALPSKPQKQEG
jgi:hypothetical protein